MNKRSARTFALAAAITAVAGGALGSGAAFADETGASPQVPAGQTVCVDLPITGVSGHAIGVSDLPVRFTLSVQDDGSPGFTLVAQSDGATTQWRGELPGATGYVVRTARACAENLGDQDTAAFLTIETDDSAVVADAPAPVAASAADQAAEAVDPQPSDEVADSPAAAVVDDTVSAVQSVVDRVEAVVAELVAEIG